MPKKVKKQHFNQIAALLKEKGYPGRDGRISLTDEAYRTIGTNKHEFQRWVRNEDQPNIQQATRLSDLVGIPIDALFPSLKKVATNV